MQRFSDLAKVPWEEIQRCLSSLTDFPLFIYDPKEKRACAPLARENPLCLLVHKTEKESDYQAAFAKQVDLAIETREVIFSKCPTNLHYFVIPISIANQVHFAIIGGKIYFSEEESLSFRKEAARQGISSIKLSDSKNNVQLGTEEALRKAAQTLQTIGGMLLENIYCRNQYESKATLLMSLLQLAGQFKKDPTSFGLNMSFLINTLGIIFDLKSAAVFYQSAKEGEHKAIAVFGEGKERLHQSKVSLDVLLQHRKKGEPYVFSEIMFNLLKCKLPSDTRFCYLFPILENDNVKVTLAILNTPLDGDNSKMIESFCQQARGAIETIVLQNQLSQQRKITQSLSDLPALAGASLYLNQLHEDILEQAVRLLQVEQGSLMMLDESSKELSVRAMKGMHKTLQEIFRVRPGEGIAGQVYQSGNPLLVKNLAQDPRILQKPKPRYKTSSFISVPLKLRDQTIGVINLADKITGQAFSEQDLQLMVALGGGISIAIERSQLHEKIEALKKISITDPLTDLLNRRYFQGRLLEEVERTRRHQIPFSLVIMDVDNFKTFNDAYGHLEGDEILRRVSRVIRKHIRAIDVASRYGGEEFTIIFPQTQKEDARIIAERLCKGIETEEVLQKKFQPSSPTVSIGLASFPDDAETAEELVRNADRALYQAKVQGKNRVVVFNQDPFPKTPFL